MIALLTNPAMLGKLLKGRALGFTYTHTHTHTHTHTQNIYIVLDTAYGIVHVYVYKIKPWC